MPTLKTTLFICMCIEAGRYAGKEGEVQAFDVERGKHYQPGGQGDTDSMGTWVTLETQEINVEYAKPDVEKFTSAVIDGLERQLEKHRAESFAREQFLQGRIAKFQALTYKGDDAAEVIVADKPDDDVDADDAEIVE